MMAAQTSKAPGDARQRRVALASEIIDRIDIARHLVLAESVSCRLALAMRLLRTMVDDVAELTGIEDEKERQAEAIKRAAAPLPRQRRTIWQKLDAVASVGIVGLACLLAAVWLGASVAIRAGWLSLAAAVVAGPLLVGEALADPQQHRTEAEAFAEGVAERCRDRDAAGMQPFDECVTQADTAIVHALNLAAQMNPDLVRQCHDMWDGDYLLTYSCMMHRLRREPSQ